MLGMYPISSRPLSVVVTDIIVVAFPMRLTASVGSVQVQADQRVAVSGTRVVTSTGNVVARAQARGVPAGQRVTVSVGQVTTQTDQHLSVTGMRATTATGGVTVFTGVRVYPAGMRVTTSVGQVVARAASDYTVGSLRIQSRLGSVEVDAKATALPLGQRMTATVGEVHLVVSAPQYITGIRMNVRVGPLRAWGDVSRWTGNEWSPVIAPVYVVEAVDAPGSVPLGALPTAGNYRDESGQQEQRWAGIDTRTGTETKEWRQVAA